MCWAACTTLCSALQSRALQFPYQAVMQLVRTLMLNFFLLLGPFHQVCSVRGPCEVLRDMYPDELEVTDPLHCDAVN